MEVTVKVVAGALLLSAAALVFASEKPTAPDCDRAARAFARWADLNKQGANVALEDVQEKLAREPDFKLSAGVLSRMANRAAYLVSMNFSGAQIRTDLNGVCMNSN